LPLEEEKERLLVGNLRPEKEERERLVVRN
jgi:hypothetical protein